MSNLPGRVDMACFPSVNRRLIRWLHISGISQSIIRNIVSRTSIWSFYDYTKLNMTRGMYYLIKSFALSGRWMAMVINTQGYALGWQFTGLSGRCISYLWLDSGRCISSSKLMSGGIAVEEGRPERPLSCQPNGNALGINE